MNDIVFIATFSEDSSIHARFKTVTRIGDKIVLVGVLDDTTVSISKILSDSESKRVYY